MPDAKRRPTGSALLRESITETIRQAMFEELAETGYARMTMEAVTRRAGVGKAALYRRWPSKEAMLIDLVSSAVRDHLPAAVDTGSFREDVQRFIADTIELLGNPLVGKILPDLFAEAARAPQLAEAMREVVAGPRRAAAAALLDRAIERGELPANLDRKLALDLLGAPLFFRLLITREPLDDRYLERLTTVTVAALTAAAE